MKTVFRKSFARDLKKVKDRRLLDRVKEAIKRVEQAEQLGAVPAVKKLSGPGDFYRIRIGDYRIGLALEDDEVEFVRILHRREIYRYFP